MSPEVKKFLQSWIINTIAVLAVTQIVSGIHYRSTTGLIIATLILGLLNASVRPLLVILSLPLVVFTFGLFYVVINATLLYLVGSLVRGFEVDSFRAAFWGALGIGVISFVLNSVIGNRNTRIVAPRRRASRHDDDGGGPIIDV